MKKKWIALVVAVLVVCNLLPPVVEWAYARGSGVVPALIAGGITGCLIGAHMRPPIIVETYSPPPTATCYRVIPGHHERVWDSYRHKYVRVWIPSSREYFPCR